MEIRTGFPIIRFYFSFYIFSIVYRVAAKFYFDDIADVFQISLYFSDNFSSFIKKDIDLGLSKSLLYALIFGRSMHKGLII